jgi:O-antigen/teichoic acid export membrane protein
MADSLGRGALASLLASYLSIPASLAANVLVARFLGPEGKGLFALFAATQGLLALPAQSAQAALIHLIADRRLAWRSVRTLLLALTALLAGLLCGVFAWSLRWGPARTVLLGGLDQAYVPLLAGALLGVVVTQLCLSVFAARQEYARGTARAFAGVMLGHGILIGSLLAQHLRGAAVTLWLVVSAHLAGVLLGSLFPLWGTLRYRGTGETELPLRAMLSNVGAFALPLLLQTLLEWLNRRVDVYFVTVFAGAAALGRYSVAVGLAQQLWTIPFSVAGPLFARVAHEGDEVRSRELVCYVFRVAALVSAALAAALLVVGPLLIRFLYGRPFEAAIPMLMALLPGAVVVGPSRALWAYFVGRGRPGESARAELVGLAATIPLDLLLIPRLGGLGAAIASSVAYLGYACFACVRFRALSGAAWSDLLLPRRDDMVSLKQRLATLGGDAWAGLRARLA